MQDFGLLAASELFRGIAREDLPEMMNCLSASDRRFSPGEYIYTPESRAGKIGLVLEGSVSIVREDYSGNRSILSRVERGGLFGEAFACARVQVLPVSVVANDDCRVLFLDYRRMITTCGNACPRHSQMIGNMVEILAAKNLFLTRKMEHITKRTTREKLLSYLYEQAQLQGRRSFEIPFDRQGLSEYLAVDRSAMSAELSRLSRDGLLRYHKNHFELPE